MSDETWVGSAVPQLGLSGKAMNRPRFRGGPLFWREATETTYFLVEGFVSCLCDQERSAGGAEEQRLSRCGPGPPPP